MRPKAFKGNDNDYDNESDNDMSVMSGQDIPSIAEVIEASHNHKVEMSKEEAKAFLNHYYRDLKGQINGEPIRNWRNLLKSWDEHSLVEPSSVFGEGYEGYEKVYCKLPFEIQEAVNRDVLDAKYYQYGVTNSVSDLPATSSIQKQITYGKHIAEQIQEVPENNVYNAFIMPFESDNDEVIRFVSVATADWETYNVKTKNYAYVLGILLDTKWLITNFVRHNNTDIEKMAEAIEDSLEYYRSNFETSP